MDINQIRQAFTPAVQEIIDICRVTDDFVDKDMFRVYVATIWGNAVGKAELKALLKEQGVLKRYQAAVDAVEKK